MKIEEFSQKIRTEKDSFFNALRELSRIESPSDLALRDDPLVWIGWGEARAHGATAVS